MARWRIMRAGEAQHLQPTESISSGPSAAGTDYQRSLRELLRAASDRNPLVAIRNEADLFDLEFPIVGIPTIRPGCPDGDVWFTLSRCSAVFRMRRDHLDWQQVQQAANAIAPAQVAVVRNAQTGFAEQCDVIDEPEISTGAVATLPRVTTEVASCDLAKTMFDLINTQACSASQNSGCIPFGFPDFGCEARAHRASKILKDHQFQNYVFKIYCARQLLGAVCTNNHPAGSVPWHSHIAPAVKVRTGNGTSVAMVLDPALYPGPVPQPRWEKRVLGDSLTQALSTHVPTWAVSHKVNEYWWKDDSLEWGDDDLLVQRLNLQKRVHGQNGAWPPYSTRICN